MALKRPIALGLVALHTQRRRNGGFSKVVALSLHVVTKMADAQRGILEARRKIGTFPDFRPIDDPIKYGGT